MRWELAVTRLEVAIGDLVHTAQAEDVLQQILGAPAFLDHEYCTTM